MFNKIDNTFRIVRKILLTAFQKINLVFIWLRQSSHKAATYPYDKTLFYPFNKITLFHLSYYREWKLLSWECPHICVFNNPSEIFLMVNLWYIYFEYVLIKVQKKYNSFTITSVRDAYIGRMPSVQRIELVKCWIFPLKSASKLTSKSAS